MKKITLSILCICALSIQILIAQSKTNDNEAKEAREHFADKFIVDVFHDLWQDVPATVDLRAIQQGISLSAMYDINLFESNFSIAAGLGINCHNFYSNAVPTRKFQDANDPIISAKTIFVPLNQYYGKEIDYDCNKISLTYLEIPLEFRFKTNPANDRPFRISLGAKVGYNINNHTKYKGEDVVEIRWDATCPTLYQIRLRGLFCTPIAWATAHMAALFVKHFPRDLAGVYPPEALPPETRQAILADARTRDFRITLRTKKLRKSEDEDEW